MKYLPQHLSLGFRPDPKPEKTEKKTPKPLKRTAIKKKQIKCNCCGEFFDQKIIGVKYCMAKDECVKAWREETNIKIQKLNKQKAAKEKKDGKESLITKGEWLNLAQKTFNTFIRIRDKDLPCVSCGVFKCEEFHAGHFIATTYQYLRFNEFNVQKQCSKCNTHLRGNSIPYRIELIKRIGLLAVEKLENDRHKNLELSIPEIKELIATYKNKIKELKASSPN